MKYSGTRWLIPSDGDLDHQLFNQHGLSQGIHGIKRAVDAIDVERGG